MEVVQLGNELKIENADQIRKESLVYSYDDKNYMHIFNAIDKDILNNKRRKIEAFKEIEDKFDIKINGIVEKNGITRGYIIEKNDSYEQLSYYPKQRKKQSNKSKIEILNNLNNYLKKLHQNNIYYGDVNFANLDVKKDSNIVRINNIDDIAINGYPFDENDYSMIRYISHFGIDEKLDTYALNLFTISYITGVPRELLFYYLKENRLPFLFDSKKNREILDAMHDFDSNDDIEPLIEHIKGYHF